MLISTKMKHEYKKTIDIPEGIECVYGDGIITCKKNGKEISKKMIISGTDIEITGKNILLYNPKTNKSDVKKIVSNIAHIYNIFSGLEKDYVYKLEICHVHFPITVKIEGNKLLINNFLGEKKKNRIAKICEGVEVEVKGKDIIVRGPDIEKTGQTAANIEKATSVVGRDRRVFQDGIFIVEKLVEEEK